MLMHSHIRLWTACECTTGVQAANVARSKRLQALECFQALLDVERVLPERSTVSDGQPTPLTQSKQRQPHSGTCSKLG
jgi:hypothetical protein